MVYKKATPKRKRPTVITTYGKKVVPKRPAIKMNYRTGGFTGLERKFLDFTHSGIIKRTIADWVQDPAQPLCLNSVPLGNGESKRMGRKIWNDTLEIQGYIQHKDSLDDEEAGATITMWIFKDKQTNEAQMIASDALVSLGGDLNAPISFENLQWQDRFELLAKRTIDLNQMVAATSGTFGSVNRHFNFHIKVNCPTTFDTDGVGGTVATITDNSLHFLINSDRLNVNEKITVQYNSRLRYYDA